MGMLQQQLAGELAGGDGGAAEGGGAGAQGGARAYGQVPGGVETRGGGGDDGGGGGGATEGEGGGPRRNGFEFQLQLGPHGLQIGGGGGGGGGALGALAPLLMQLGLGEGFTLDAGNLDQVRRVV